VRHAPAAQPAGRSKREGYTLSASGRCFNAEEPPGQSRGVGEPELAVHQGVGRERKPGRQVGRGLDDKPLRSVAGDLKGELAAGQKERGPQLELREAHVKGPGNGLDEEIGGVVTHEAGVVGHEGGNGMGAVGKGLA